MKKHGAENERIKRRYFAFMKEAKRHSEPTVDAATNNYLLIATRYKPLQQSTFGGIYGGILNYKY
jgi:hypothetical protein